MAKMGGLQAFWPYKIFISFMEKVNEPHWSFHTNVEGEKN